MALPQQDNLIEQLKREDAKLEYAVMNGMTEEAERIRERMRKITERMQ